MNSFTYIKYNIAKENNNLNLMEEVYKENPNDLEIKISYAKMLAASGNSIQSRIILEELLFTKSRNYALLELGKLSLQDGNNEDARKYFNDILSINNKGDKKEKSYARFELGKLDMKIGNLDKARINFNNCISNCLDERHRNYCLLELGRLEFQDRNVDEAIKHFNKCLQCYINNKDRECILNLLILCDIENEDYLSAFNKLKQMMIGKLKIEVKALFFLCKKLNISINEYSKKFKINTSIMQILDYDENIALNHIIEKHVKNNQDFNSNIDIYKLFDNIKNELVEENRIPKLIFNDIYSIPYENIGSSGQRYIKVVTIPRSKDIITMFPIKNKFDIDYESELDDANNNQIEDCNIKIKKLKK